MNGKTTNENSAFMIEASLHGPEAFRKLQTLLSTFFLSSHRFNVIVMLFESVV